MPHAKCSIYEDGRNKGGSFCHTAFCCIAKKIKYFKVKKKKKKKQKKSMLILLFN